MKRKFLLLALFLNVSLNLNAQTPSTLDKEKLLNYYQTQHYEEAAKYLDTVYGSDTRDQKALSQIAYVNLMAGKLSEAEKNYLKLDTLQPGNLSVLFNLAAINARRGNTLKAKGYYLTILKIDSVNFNVYKQLAGMIASDTSSEKLFYLNKANKINPTNGEIAYDLANGYHISKKDELAYNILIPAIQEDTNNLGLLKVKLPVCIALLKFKEALLVGQKLMLNGDSSSFIINSMGNIAYKTKAYQNALDFFNILEKRADQTEASLYYTALCYRELKNYSSARLYIKKAIEEGISPNTSGYYNLLGTLYEKNNQLTNAAVAYKKGLQFKNDGEIYYSLGLLYDLKLKNKKSAVNYYTLYLQSKSNSETSKEVTAYVKGRLILLRGGQHTSQ